MSAIGQLYYNLLVDESDPAIMSTIPSDVFYNGNIVTFYGAQGFSKLGIQAPPGSQAQINEATITIGPNGIYELDHDGVVVTSLSFVRPGGSKVVSREIGYQFIRQGQIDAERNKDASEESLKDYSRGVNSIYVARSDTPCAELYNVIIDFIYE